MFYFRITPFYTTDLEEIRQFSRVVKFRRKLKDLGVLYWTYDTHLEFERSVREHLIRQILQLTDDTSRPQRPSASTIAGPRQNIIAADGVSIFMAYSHEDRDTVRTIYNALKAAGYRPWIDLQNLLPGQLWHREIDEAIRQTNIVLLFLSARTDLKGYVASEITLVTSMLAKSHGPILVPVRLDPVELPGNLQELKAVDYFLPDGQERLLEAIDYAWRTCEG